MRRAKASSLFSAVRIAALLKDAWSTTPEDMGSTGAPTETISMLSSEGVDLDLNSFWIFSITDMMGLPGKNVVR